MMNSKILGSLTQHPQINSWLQSEEIEIPYFDNKKLKVVIEKGSDENLEDYDKAIENFLKLSEVDREDATEHVNKNYEQVIEDFGDDFALDKESPADIWSYVYPKQIMVQRRSKDNKVYVVLLAECEWEEEHGLQIIYREGRELSRVSGQDGHLTYSDAYGVSDAEDRIN